MQIYIKMQKRKHFIVNILKIYKNSQIEFPTRNTKTKVFGSDETEENIYINTENNSINTLVSQNNCVICSTQQNINLIDNIGCGAVACPGCGRMVSEQMIAQYNFKLRMTVNNGTNSLCPECQNIDIKAQQMVDAHLCQECGRVTEENQ